MLFHNKANSSSQKSGCSSKGKSTLKVCFMCQAREFGRCTSFGTLPKQISLKKVVYEIGFGNINILFQRYRVADV